MTKEGTKILPCTCDHNFQDKKYGPKMRVWNSTLKHKNPASTTYRCTACGVEKTVAD